jgi:pyruvate/2-oxoglutarate dehydrogenase complex dihydrolipoamide acyltransferase (E2) component
MLRVIAAVLIVVFLTSTARACVDVPAFSTRLERASLPTRPASPVSGGELETYRLDLEAAREIKIEGFNNRRKRFAGRLLETRAEIAAAVTAGECTAAEAKAAEAGIRKGIRYVTEDMQDEYNDILSYYFVEQQWYATIFNLWKKCRAAGKCKEGYPYV